MCVEAMLLWVEDNHAAFKYAITPGIKQAGTGIIKNQSLFNAFVEERKEYQKTTTAYDWEQEPKVSDEVFMPPPPEFDGVPNKQRKPLLEQWATKLHYYLWKKGNNPGRFSWGRWLLDYDNALSIENYPTHWKRCEPKYMSIAMLNELVQNRYSYGPLIDRNLVPKSRKRKRQKRSEDNTPGERQRFDSEDTFGDFPSGWVPSSAQLNYNYNDNDKTSPSFDPDQQLNAALQNHAGQPTATGVAVEGRVALGQPCFSFPQDHHRNLSNAATTENPQSPIFNATQDTYHDLDALSFSLPSNQNAQVSADILALSQSIFHGYLEIDDPSQALQGEDCADQHPSEHPLSSPSTLPVSVYTELSSSEPLLQRPFQNRRIHSIRDMLNDGTCLIN